MGGDIKEGSGRLEVMGVYEEVIGCPGSGDRMGEDATRIIRECLTLPRAEERRVNSRTTMKSDVRTEGLL